MVVDANGEVNVKYDMTEAEMMAALICVVGERL